MPLILNQLAAEIGHAPEKLRAALDFLVAEAERRARKDAANALYCQAEAHCRAVIAPDQLALQRLKSGTAEYEQALAVVEACNAKHQSILSDLCELKIATEAGAEVDLPDWETVRKAIEAQ